MRNGLPVIALCGYGRAGKDTAAEWLRDHTVLRFSGGCSWTALPYMARRLSEDFGRLVTEEEAYRRRHEDRMKWYTYMNEYRKDEYRKDDPARLIRDVLQHSDLVCGVRDRCELLAAREEQLLDLVVWIDRDVPVDPTVTYSIDDCDIVVRNHGTIHEFHQRLYRLARSLRLFPW